MDLHFFATLPEKKIVTTSDQKKMQSMWFSPSELAQLKTMQHDTLLGLMAFCGIRKFNDIPVIACTSDELRLAYCVWRAEYSQKEKEKILNIFRKLGG